MSRNGYEMDDDQRDSSSSDLDDSSDETSVSVAPPAVAGAKARAKKPRAKATKKAGARKSVAPRSRRADLKTPQSMVVDLANTITLSPGKNPARRSQHPDHISIPPADLDEHDERFFAEGETVSQRGEHLSRPSRVKAGQASSSDISDRPLSHVVPLARRQKLANYVKIAVAVSSVVCLAALARVGLSKANHGGERSAAAAQVVAHAPITTIAHADPIALAPAADENAAGHDHTFAEEAAPAVPLKSAHEEREDARNALEHGKAKDAIEAATRSITVDPTDAEAWLLLGAANQEAGHPADAHAAFVECTKQAKTGNVGECGAMLSWNGPR
jgi:hypothetical protein